MVGAVRALAQIAKQVVAEIVATGLLQVARGHYLIGIDIDLGERHRHRIKPGKGPHDQRPPSKARTSVMRPVTAAAAAIAGLIRWVREPGP